MTVNAVRGNYNNYYNTAEKLLYLTLLVVNFFESYKLEGGGSGVKSWPCTTSKVRSVSLTDA